MICCCLDKIRRWKPSAISYRGAETIAVLYDSHKFMLTRKKQAYFLDKKIFLIADDDGMIE